MAKATRTTRVRFWLWLIRAIGVIVPRRLRADWRQEWEAELQYREELLAEWDKLNWRAKFDLLWHSAGAVADALWIQPRRLEDEMSQDLRFGLRMLLKNPGFSLVAVLLLGLGIGANTALFGVVDAILLKRLPVKEPEQLVLLSHTGGTESSDSFSYRSYERFRDHGQALSGVLAYYPLRLTVSVDRQPEPALDGQLVSGNYYQVLGTGALLGRTLAPDDDREPGAHPVCVISHGYWRRRFGRDPAIIGKTIQLGGFPFTIIGVTPPEFFGLEVGSSMDISVPLMMQQQVMPGIESFVEDWRDRFRVMGRLRPGVTLPQAQASLGLLYQQYIADLVALLSGDEKGKMISDRYLLGAQLSVASGSQGLSDLRRQFSQSLLILLSVAAMALLIACANVAGLLLARGVARRKEMAVRLTVGASRLRLVRQLLTESVLLAGLGGLFGLVFAWWGMRLFLPLLSQRDIPLHLSLNLDFRMLGFTSAVAVLTALLSGLVPAFFVTRVELQSTLKQDAQWASGRAARLSLGQVFVIAQVALSLLLVVGAGLFVRSLQNLRWVETGFARENVLLLKLEPAHSNEAWNYRPQLIAFYDELLRRTKALPGVRQASLVGYSPISRSEWLATGPNPEQNSSWLSIEGRPPVSEEEMTFSWMAVYPHSFATLGIPLVAGRDFNERDSRKSPTVVVINESLGRHFFGGENPIGRRVGLGQPQNATQMEIIGVVKDVRYSSLREASRPMFYKAFSQDATGSGQMTLVVRTAVDPSTLAAAVQREARALDPVMPMFAAETLEAQLDASLIQERLLARLSSVFGLLALVLVCIGLYGVMSYDVARRTHEIGIRLALGAQISDVIGLVMRRTMLPVVIGVIIGLGAALLSTRWLTSLLYGLTPNDPLTIALASLLLLTVAALTGYLPARRATRVDPLVALKHE